MSSPQKPNASASQLELFDEFHMTAVHLSRLLPTWDLLFPFVFSKSKVLPPDTHVSKIPLLKYEWQMPQGRFRITVKPALLDGTGKRPTRVIHAGEREELVANALRALFTRGEISAEVDTFTNKEGETFPVIQLGFYVNQVATELKRTGHTHSHTEIDEALEVLANTLFSLENIIDGQEAEKAPALPYYRKYLTKGDKRIVVLNEIEAAQILDRKFRAVNNDLSLRLPPIARWIYKYIHSEHSNAEQIPKDGSLPPPCEIAYSTLVERGVVPKGIRLKDACERVRSAMEKLAFQGVFHRTDAVPKGYVEKPITKPTKGRPKTEDVNWLMYISQPEVEQIILENTEAKYRNPVYQHLPAAERRRLTADARKQLMTPKLLPPARPSAIELLPSQDQLFSKPKLTPTP